MRCQNQLNEKIEKVLNIGQSPEQPLTVDWARSSGISVTVKRDDLLHPIISGNKWRKLKFALLTMLTGTGAPKHLHIVSFGGGFSNHVHALAYCCHQLAKQGTAITFTAIIRGDYSANLSPMLSDIIRWGANVKYVDRVTYKKREDKTYLDWLKSNYQNSSDTQVVIIPEGGSQHSAITGFTELTDELSGEYDYILCPVASGGTMAGLVSATESLVTKVIGVAVLKGKDYLEQLVTDLLPANCLNVNWVIEHDYHCGGYAKKSTELVEFCQQFFAESAIPIEPVYSGKLFFALKHLITHNYFPTNSRILVLHTGGLQGARGDYSK